MHVGQRKHRQFGEVGAQYTEKGERDATLLTTLIDMGRLEAYLYLIHTNPSLSALPQYRERGDTVWMHLRVGSLGGF